MNKAYGFNKGRFSAFVIILTLLSSGSMTKGAIVSFGFKGAIYFAENPSNYVAGVSEGTTVTGVVTYDTSLTRTPSGNPLTESYGFTNAAGFSAVLQMGGHTFTCAASTNGGSGILVNDNNFGEDLFTPSFNTPLIRLNGAEIPPEFIHGGFQIYLRDTNQTAFSSDTLPVVRPNLAAFASRYFEIAAYKPGLDGYLFDFYGEITEITEAFEPQLNIRRTANGNVLLAWPLTASGFSLQSRTNLMNGNWQTILPTIQDTATEHTATIPPTAQPAFFRLVK